MIFSFRITDEPLFLNLFDDLTYYERFGYGNNNENNLSVIWIDVLALIFVSILLIFLIPYPSHRESKNLHRVARFHFDEFDNGSMSEDYDDEQPNEHKSSQGDLDGRFSK
jgi:hypothetical protein